MAKMRTPVLYAFVFAVIVIVFVAEKRYSFLPFAKKSELQDRGAIYFIETSDNATLNRRQACSVESAARANPSKRVTVIITGTGLLAQHPWVVELQKLHNVFVEMNNIVNLFRYSPLEEWYEKRAWQNSPHKVYHLSDALRLVTVWQRGGIYLDLDFMVLRPLTKFSNTLALEHSQSVTNAIFSFEKGNKFLLKCIKDLDSTYDPGLFAVIGPGLATHCFQQYCNEELIEGYYSKCNVRLLPVEAAYPVLFDNWPELFAPAPPLTNFTTYYKSSYAVHIFNKVSQGTTIPAHSVYDLMMKTLCPGVYGSVRNAS